MMRFIPAAIHWIWRLLPRDARRRLFVRVTSLAAPSPGRSPAHLPVVVAGVLSSATGLGESARMNVEGVRRAGLPFSAVDLSGSLFAGADLPRFTAPDAISPIGPGTLVLHTPGSTLPYALVRCGHKLVRDKRLVGFWHWELPSLPEDWRFGCDRVDEVWVPSRFCADAVRKSFAGPIRIIPHPVDVEGVAHVERRRDRFTALTIFNMASGFERKNPIASVRAFKQAFGADPAARLIIKVVNPHHYPKGMEMLQAVVDGAANIDILTEVIPRKQVMNLIAGADAVLSLHRSEGFGMLAAEAMLLGTPVIATDWSATAEFVTEDTGIPVPYRMVAAVDPQGCSHDPAQSWADADINAAAAGLTRLRDDPDFAARLGRQGRETAHRQFSIDRYVQSIHAALQPEATESSVASLAAG
jgi:glycosyltransferase involved in cell wall biosynthesis